VRKAVWQYCVLWIAPRQDALQSDPLLVAYGRPAVYPVLLAIFGLIGLFGNPLSISAQVFGVAVLVIAFVLSCHRRAFTIHFDSQTINIDVGVWPFNRKQDWPFSAWKSVTVMRARRSRVSLFATSQVAVRYVVVIDPGSVDVPYIEVPNLMFDQSEDSAERAVDMASMFADRLRLPLMDRTCEDVQPFVFLF